MRNYRSGLAAIAALAALTGACGKKPATKPDAVRLESSRPEISADDGTLAVTASAYQNGVRLHDIAIKLTLALTDSAGNAVSVTQAPALMTDTLGETSFTYASLRTASKGTVQADVLKADGVTPYLDKAGQPLLTTLNVSVDPGRPAVISESLTPASGIILPNDALTVDTVVRDAWNNVTPAAVQISTNAPNALLVGNQLTGMKVSGSYQVVSSVSGTSISATKNLTVGVGLASSVVLFVSRNAIIAGTSVAVSTKVYDPFGNLVDGQTAPTTFAVVGLSGATYTPDAVLANTGTLSTLTAAGSYSIKASLAGANPPTDSEALLISPAPAAMVTLLTSLPSILPGGSITATTTVRDAFSNLTTDPVNLSTNAPGAVITGASGTTWTVSGVTRAGSYQVVAAVAGVPLSAAKSLTVTPGSQASIVLTLAAPSWDAGQTITGVARVYDANGNEIVPPPMITASTTIPGATATASNNDISVTGVARTGTFQITATITSTLISNSDPVTIMDVSVPTVSFTGLVANQSVGLNGNPSSIGYSLNVSATDTVGVAKIEGYVTNGGELDGFGTFGGTPSFVANFPNNTINATASTFFTVNAATSTRTSIQITFQATDMSGNVSNITRIVFADPAANLLPSLVTGLSVRTVAEDPGFGFVADAMDCAGGAGVTLAVADARGGGGIYQFPVPSAGTFHTYGSGSDLVDAPGGQPRGVAYAPNGSLYDLYVGYQGSGNQLLRYPGATLPSVVVNTLTETLATPRHLLAETRGTATLLYAVEQGGGGRVRRYDITTPPMVPIAANLTFITGNATGTPYGISSGSMNLFVTSRNGNAVQTVAATTGGALVDYLTGLASPQGVSVAPAGLPIKPAFSSLLFFANNANAGGLLAPIGQVNQTSAASVAVFASGIDKATDTAWCNNKLYLNYDKGTFTSRVVEVSGF